ncbi:MAG TPA: hypothetical protein VM510_14470, partial [Caulifigura sp.]|nr:hypothetical protein [Caulifigura sp.]
PRPSGTLYVASGSVNVRRGNLPPISGEATVQSMEWTNPAVDNFSPDAVPLWLDPETKTLASQKNWARQYEDEFQLDTPVQNSISPVAETDKRNTIALYATRTMSLIDEVPTLVHVLTSPHEDVRFAAIVGLREWVMTSPDYAPRLQEEINRVFRDQEAPIVNKLLWRISDAEAHDEAASMQVVDWLANDNIAIRDLAYYEVFTRAGRDLGYRPQNTVGQREPALMRWRELVRRNKGLVPTVAEPAAPPAANPPAQTPPPPAPGVTPPAN